MHYNRIHRECENWGPKRLFAIDWHARRWYWQVFWASGLQLFAINTIKYARQTFDKTRDERENDESRNHLNSHPLITDWSNGFWACCGCETQSIGRSLCGVEYLHSGTFLFRQIDQFSLYMLPWHWTLNFCFLSLIPRRSWRWNYAKVRNKTLLSI